MDGSNVMMRSPRLIFPFPSAAGDTLPALVAMVSQHHKELEGLPDDVKVMKA